MLIEFSSFEQSCDNKIKLEDFKKFRKLKY